MIEPIIEEEEVKPQPESKPKPRAKPNINITEAPVEAMVGDPIIEEHPAPVKVVKLKKIVQFPDCV